MGEEYTNFISSENDVLFSEGGRQVKTPHTQLGTDRDWQISTGEGEGFKPAIEILNKELLKLNETLTKVTNMIRQTEICSVSPVPKQSDLTKNTFQAIEIDPTQYFDRDICPAGMGRRNEMFVQLKSDQGAT